MMTNGASDVVTMAGMGLTTTVLAPLVVWSRRGVLPRRLRAVPAPAVLAGFAVVHAAVTLTMGVASAPPEKFGLWLLLLCGACVFWVPVLASQGGLSAPGKVLYLFIASPSLDLAAVGMVIAGDRNGGLAMIAAMIPLGAAGMASVYGWAVAEERSAQRSAAAGRR
ncbi:hypothetical protein K6U06_01990 [Acidiferrimicrobium sp. IK]|uniref:hypothetical protein n=1 Tax=Acidiferrimicrobium sp. IK TaxID=2871700 RepID=UPI0021CB7AA2|nr:hypothetical protein [Acidiferrimicrobium sp. IK]MCU4183115.1 hypothetical protein [Acidiferrimicrobium sp. IK]